MFYRNLKQSALLGALGLAMLLPAPSRADDGQRPAFGYHSERQITGRIRHELARLRNYGVFDHLEFRVNGSTVTLMGQASRPMLKSDAEAAIRRIEGVTTVRNKIEVLPLSGNDDRLRALVYHRVYRTPALQKYTSNGGGPILNSPISRWMGITKDPPTGYHAIHIIVRNGQVVLEGAVSANMDRTLANIQANSVPGVFSVTNNLRIDG